MSKIMELRTKRNTLWEQTKAFLEKHRGENGLVEASAVETYNKMAADVQALGAEIERLEQQAAVDAALSTPTSKPVTNVPTTPTDTGRKQPETNATASSEYSDAFWNMIRNKGDQFAVRNALSVGEDEWLEQFNTFSIYEVLPQLFELWGMNLETQAESKKALARLTAK